MKLNPDKCQLFLNTKEETALKIDNVHIKNFSCEKLLDINFDCKQASQSILKTFAKKHLESQRHLQN